MYQNWLGIDNWVREHQADILREAEKARAIEAMRRRHRDAALRALQVRARAGCVERDGAPGAPHASHGHDGGRPGAAEDCAEKRPA
jgi:hypothetical protein